jgi:uncharacterized repeat protein (TIGR02543 family)
VIAPGTTTVNYGSSQSFTVTASTGYSVSSVVVDGSSVGAVSSYQFTNVQAAHTITATFTLTQITYMLTVQQPNGLGSTTPATGSYTYNQGTIIQVTATPASGWQVDYWVVDGSIISNVNSITVTMNSAHVIKVYFTLIQFALTLSVSGLGTVTLSPPGGAYASGTVVTLTATPAADYSFAGWSGDLSSSTNPATVTMNGNKTVTATFTQIQYMLTISVTGSGSTNPTIGSSSYASGSIVQVAATPSSGWQFSHWHLDGVDSGTTSPTTVTMNSAHTLEAVFTSTGVTPTHILSVTGSTYYLKVVATGATTSSTSIQTLVNSIPNGATVQVDTGTYYLPTNTGLVLTGRSNISFYGESNVVFKSAMPTPTVMTQALGLDDCTNIQLHDLTFDMDYPNNPNNLPEASYGTQWGARDNGGTNDSIIGCQFLNIGGSGLVISSTGLQVVNCTFNHLNEHTLYITRVANLHVEGCTFLNYGKLGRGYGPKIQDSHDLYFDNCYYEPNQDGTGFTTWSVNTAETGARGTIISNVTNLFVTNCEWYSASPNPYIFYPIFMVTSIESHNLNFTDCTWTNFGQPTYPSGTYHDYDIAQTHLTNCTFK